MESVEYRISELLRKIQQVKKKLYTIGTVESATGGRIGDKITNVPYSSDYYKGSIIAYSNEVKMGIIGVKKETLVSKGAVSAETAIEMATGGRKLLKVDICLSDTGIAGPTGNTVEKPIGLFYIGLSAKDGTVSKKHNFHGNREQNKQCAAEASLNFLEEYLRNILNINLAVKNVVTCFIRSNDKILILRRSQKVGTYKGKWSGVSGYIEGEILDQAYNEIREEIGLGSDDVRLIKQGVTLEIVDENLNIKWLIHPFLFSITVPEKIKIDWENLEIKWINPQEINNFETVPGLKEAFDRVS